MQASRTPAREVHENAVAVRRMQAERAHFDALLDRRRRVARATQERRSVNAHQRCVVLRSHLGECDRRSARLADGASSQVPQNHVPRFGAREKALTLRDNRTARRASHPVWHAQRADRMPSRSRVPQPRRAGAAHDDG